MKNKILITASILLMTTILCSSCSGDSNQSKISSVSNISNMDTQSSSSTDSDNYSFNFDNSTVANTAEGEWNAMCSSIKEDIEGIEGINSVTIEPADYNKYVQDGIALIYINHDNNYAYSQSEDEALHQYIDNFKYFSDYKLIFDGKQ